MKKAPPEIGEGTTVFDLGLAREVLADGRVTLTVGPKDAPVLIIKNRRGVFAMQNRCPHAGIPLDSAAVRRRHIKCVAHGRKYDMTSGVCRNGPGTRPLLTYRVWIHQGHLFLALRAEAV
jgi:3-phenylpropionate/trans-cinnamate dioxygenase ferredoxin component